MSTTFPQKFGKYILVRKIATGGMAEIFQAKTAGAEGFEKDIVIKRILPHFSEDEAFVQMFIDEASITAKLQHANIVQIYDFDVIDGSYYIAMEFIEGEDLSAVLEDAQKAGMPLSVAQCVWITMELAKGLHYAHVKEYKGRPLNIIHRDISPHNAMISYNGEVKLMDFGIAKAAERSTKTQAGTVKGKVAYMSPEQARGRTLDGRSDLFALATVLWEMLTGKRLFLRNSDFETLTAVLKEDVAPPSRLRQGIDQDLDDIILTALEKDREHRHKNVEAFNRELTRWYYKNVDDLDRERLKPLLQRIYTKKRDYIDPAATLIPGSVPAVNVADTVPPRPSEATVALPSRRDVPDDAPPTIDVGELRRAPRRPSARQEPVARVRPPAQPKFLRDRKQKSGVDLPRAPGPQDDDPGMTIEEPVENIIAAAKRSRVRAAQAEAPTQDVGRARGKGKGGPEAFFSSPETLMENSGPSQAEVLRALQEARRAGEGPPDVSLNGRAAAQSDGSRTGVIVVLAFIFLALGGLIAFLLAP